MFNKGLNYIIPLILVIVLLIIGALAWGNYNSMISLGYDVDGSWAQVENVYQRRADLIPNLETATKAVLTQEKEVFTKLAEARANYAGTKTPGSGATTDEKAAAASQLDSAISRLLVVMENYPELKSNETVANLMTQLEGSENRIATERGRYNEKVTEYNKKIAVFPNNLFAGLFGIKERKFYKAVEGSDKAPQIKL